MDKLQKLWLRLENIKKKGDYKMKVYSIYDSKAEAYLKPFYARTRGEAERMFGMAANEEDHEFNRHAADYTLFEVGTFNEDTGDILGLSPIIGIANALTLKAQFLNDSDASSRFLEKKKE